MRGTQKKTTKKIVSEAAGCGRLEGKEKQLSSRGFFWPRHIRRVAGKNKMPAGSVLRWGRKKSMGLEAGGNKKETSGSWGWG